MTKNYQIAIIGGGFYGVSLALHLRRYAKNIIIIDAASDIFSRATYNNQARIHNGYHYPRSYVTALRSRHNFQRFITQYQPAVSSNHTHLYAISSRNSKVTAHQFVKFMNQVGAEISESDPNKLVNFNSDMIEAVFNVKEVVFNAKTLKRILKSQLTESGIKLLLNSQVSKVVPSSNQLHISVKNQISVITADQVFCCTYAGTNHLLSDLHLPLLPIKHELTEMALVSVPPQLQNMAVTVMDGPFFSLMPFPAQNLHTLSHVRYTPHQFWTSTKTKNGAYHSLVKPPKTHFPFMLKDAARYLPIMSQVCHQKSLFEVKSVLIDNEQDDGRPIVFRTNYGGLSNFHVVLGGKIDNIYDILSKVDDYFSNSNSR